MLHKWICMTNSWQITLDFSWVKKCGGRNIWHNEKFCPKSTHSVNKWAMKIFGEWQVGRRNKKACEEESQFAMETSQIQDLETNICDAAAESLNFWLTNLIMEVCKRHGRNLPSMNALQYLLWYSALFRKLIKDMRSSFGARRITGMHFLRIKVHSH